MLVLLTALTVFGRLWFLLVEFLLERAKRLLFRHDQPPAWHTLPDEKEEGNGSR